jgi:hypothetical protein
MCSELTRSVFSAAWRFMFANSRGSQNIWRLICSAFADVNSTKTLSLLNPMHDISSRRAGATYSDTHTHRTKMLHVFSRQVNNTKQHLWSKFECKSNLSSTRVRCIVQQPRKPHTNTLRIEPRRNYNTMSDVGVCYSVCSHPVQIET